tara:strand:- start:451 stop:729 length:279 start_codon:yes stop_codon:yes gene_type:complete
MSKKISKTPRHIHDCDNCVFLGTWYRYDLYSCTGEFLTTVVARYTSNGPDYTSCDLRHAKQIEEEKAEGTYKIYSRQNALLKAMALHLTLKI